MFTVEVIGVDDPAALLRAVQGVRSVDRSEGRWIVHADRDVRRDIHDAVVDAGGRFAHLSRDRADLDAIYHRYFHDIDADHFDRDRPDRDQLDAGGVTT